jgi:phosphate/sulfate permease
VITASTVLTAWIHAPYLYGVIAVIATLVLSAVIFRQRFRRLIRLAKALATDKRLPRPVRWLFGASLAVKAVPFPDFGVDEIALGIGIALLLTVYRRQFAEIRRETRRAGSCLDGP